MTAARLAPTASQRHRERRRCVRAGQPVPIWAHLRITPGRRRPAPDPTPPAAPADPTPPAAPPGAGENWQRIQAAGRHLDAAMLARPVYPSDTAKINAAVRHHQIALSMAAGMIETSAALDVFQRFVLALYRGPILTCVHPSQYAAFADGIAAAWQRAGLDGPAPRMLCAACGRAPGGPGGAAAGPSGGAGRGPNAQGAPADTRQGGARGRQGGDTGDSQGGPAGDTVATVATRKKQPQPSTADAKTGGGSKRTRTRVSGP